MVCGHEGYPRGEMESWCKLELDNIACRIDVLYLDG